MLTGGVLTHFRQRYPPRLRLTPPVRSSSWSATGMSSFSRCWSPLVALTATARRSARKAGLTRRDVTKVRRDKYDGRGHQRAGVRSAVRRGARQILTTWTSGAFVLVVGPSMLSEYRRVGRELTKGRPALDAALDALLALIAVYAAVVDAPPLDAPVSADPDDEQFLAAA